MNGPEIITKLRENEPPLRARGVTHAALFGSRARGDNPPDSDTDIMIEIDPDAPVGVYEYVRIKEYVATLLEGRVDVVDKEGLKPPSGQPLQPTPSMLSKCEAIRRGLNDIQHHIAMAQGFVAGMN